MMSPADEIWLARLLEAIQRTKRYQERGEAEFFGNEDTQQLVIHNLEHIVESADHLSQHFKKDHPGVDWTRLRKVRTMIIHGYAELPLSDVWEFLRSELPTIEKRLLKIRSRPGAKP
jgi:uncharacterized protein with HEPN domain